MNTANDSDISTIARATVSTPRVMLVGSHSQLSLSGITIGLAVALKKKSISPTIATLGMSLVESTHYRRVSGRLSHSLDLWALNAEQLQLSFSRICQGSELVIVKGSGGLFDRNASDFAIERQAELASKFKLPIILVVDAQGYRESIAALIHGFATYLPSLNLAGVIALGIENEEHGTAIKNAIAKMKDTVYLGGLSKEQTASLFQKDEATEAQNESLLPRSQLLNVANIIESAIDFEALKTIAESAAAVELLELSFERPELDCRIAVADDAAFHLTVQDNLDLIRRAGGSLVAFSPLTDHKFPKQVHGLYLSGGYLEVYAADLSENRPMMAALREFVEDGGVVYAEGSGILSLCLALSTSDGRTFPMAGVLPGTASLLSPSMLTGKSSPCEVKSLENTIVTKTDEKFRGQLEQRWLLQPAIGVRKCFEIWPRTKEKESGQKLLAIVEGFSPKPSILGTGVQAHWASNPRMAQQFVSSVTRRIREKRAGSTE